MRKNIFKLFRYPSCVVYLFVTKVVNEIDVDIASVDRKFGKQFPTYLPTYLGSKVGNCMPRVSNNYFSINFVTFRIECHAFLARRFSSNLLNLCKLIND